METGDFRLTATLYSRLSVVTVVIHMTACLSAVLFTACMFYHCANITAAMDAWHIFILFS